MKKKLTILIGAAAIIAFGFLLLLKFSQKVEYKYPVEDWNESIAYKTKRVADKELWEGDEKIAKEGIEGTKRCFRYFEEKYVNGRQEYREEISPAGKPKEKVIKQPVSKVVHYGTKKGYPTGYVWEIKGEDHYASEFFGEPRNHSLRIKAQKMVLKNNVLEIYFNVENLNGGMSYETVKVPRPFVGDVVEYSTDLKEFFQVKNHEVETEGPAIFKAGQKIQLKLKVLEATDHWPNSYTIDFGKTHWLGYVSSISLDKFWVGPFNKR